MRLLVKSLKFLNNGNDRHIATANALDLGPSVIASLNELLDDLQRLLEGLDEILQQFP